MADLSTPSGWVQSLLTLNGALPGPDSLSDPLLEHRQRRAGTGHPAAGSGEESVWDRGAAVAGARAWRRGAGPPEYPDAASALGWGTPEARRHPHQPGGHAHPRGWPPADCKSGMGEGMTSWPVSPKNLKTSRMLIDRRWIDNNNLEQGMRQGNKIMQIFFLHPISILLIVSKYLLSTYYVLSIVLWDGVTRYSCQWLTALWRRQIHKLIISVWRDMCCGI